jgi:hypothetical protein
MEKLLFALDVEDGRSPLHPPADHTRLHTS